jgi:hypothetical protein
MIALPEEEGIRETVLPEEGIHPGNISSGPEETENSRGQRICIPYIYKYK